ncbi:UDP-glucose 6-dehydrogenase [Musa troglodytarum]|uniref:UDP-glucose 6-dehydrogenase n=1 Tax=Musa troglodytarum TaxID=320322 RepID=A0A9E7EQC8_9LILI|nr:UDP-glucose 6-dehydrogenase [Musa troglodytarum]
MFNTVSGKKIAVLGFAFKKDTGGRPPPSTSARASCGTMPRSASTTPR